MMTNHSGSGKPAWRRMISRRAWNKLLCILCCLLVSVSVIAEDLDDSSADIAEAITTYVDGDDTIVVGEDEPATEDDIGSSTADEEVVAPPSDEEIEAILGEEDTIGHDDEWQSRAGLPIISITKNKQKVSVTLGIGEQVQIKASSATATSRKPAIASVDDDLVITAVAKGSTYITVAFGKNKATITVKVVDPSIPDSISLPSTITVSIGETVQLAPTILPSTATSELSWVSAKSKIASVTAAGLVEGVSEGSTKITVTTSNKKKATVKVKVIDPYKPDSISFDASTITVNVGDTKQLEPILVPSTAKTTYTWKPSKAKVATVSSSGEITAIAEGSAKITVTTSNKKKATITVKVIDPYKPDSISFDASTITVNVGETVQLEPILVPSTAKTTYTWKSDRAKVATVTSSGKITAIAEGSTKITVTTSNKKKAYITVKVIDPYKPDSISLGESSVTVNLGETLQLYPLLTPTTAKTTYTWKSSSEKVATVSSTGLVTAKKVGRTSITCTTANKKKAKVTIVVAKIIAIPDSPPDTTGIFRITFMDIGRNDGILIGCEGEWVFFDSGLHGRGVQATEYMQSLGVTHLKYYVGTHAHNDHIAGAPVILDNIEVDEVIVPHDYAISAIKKYAETASERDAVNNASYRVVQRGETIHLGGAKMLVVGPVTIGSHSKSKENANSLILRVTYGSNTFLLTGDATSTEIAEAEKANPGIMDVQVLKNPHHYQHTPIIYDLAKPEITVFSTENSYKPSSKTIRYLEDLGSRIYITASRVDGNVTIVSNGSRLDVYTNG